MTQLERADRWLLLFVFAISLALRVAFTANFDGLYGQDAYAYYNYAIELHQAISNHHALEPSFYPLGYTTLLAISFSIFGTSPLAAQALNLLLGALLAPLVYVLTCQFGAKQPSALTAALIMAFCGQAIQSSIVVMADIPALFWATVSAVALLGYLRTDRRRWLLIAALTLALAGVTRWLCLALIPVWGAALLLTWRRVRWRDLLAAGSAAALVLLPQALVSFRSPDSALDHHFVAGWSINNILHQNFSNTEGQFDYSQINAHFYAHPYFDPYYLAPIFTPSILLGFWSIRRQYDKLVLLFGWALLPYLFLVGIPYQNIRYPLIVVPAVALLAGIGVEALFSRPFLSQPVRRVAYTALLICTLAWTFTASQPVIRQFVANQTRDKAAVQWAIQHIPPTSRVYSYGLTESLTTYASFDVHELYSETPQTLEAQLADGTGSYLFTNIWVIENQWAGRSLQTTYHWLRDNAGLQYLDRFGNYILFKVNHENWTPASGLQQSVG